MIPNLALHRCPAGMVMIQLARAKAPLGEPIMSERELAVFVSAFESSSFTASIH